MSDATSQIKNKRKRKKSFLRNARKYAKKGCYGRGSQLDADTYQYFVRIMEVYREGFPTDEEKLVFVNNVFDQTENQEVDCSCNQVGCRVVEMLLPFANETVLSRYMKSIGEDLRRLCSDRFASHVIEALLTETCRRSLITDGIGEESRQKYMAFTVKISRFLLNNLEDYMWDTYGNHIVRSVLSNLGNLPREPTTKKETNVINVKQPIEIPEEYKEIIKEYAERLLTWPQFKDLPFTEITSGFMQTLLRALKTLYPKLLKKYLKRLLEESFILNDNSNTVDESNFKVDKNTNIPQVFTSKPAVMLLEMALQVAKRKMFTQIYAKCFKGNLVNLAKLRAANFAVQKLLNHCEEKVEFEAMFDELADHFQEITDAGHLGVILSLGQTCKRLAARQGSFVQKIMELLDCVDPVERQIKFALCLSKFTSFDKLQSTSDQNLQEDKLSLQGTLILQLMLEFNKPIKIVNSILNTETEDLKNLFSNSMGSHIVDSYVKSTFVGEKSREKLLKKLQGTYQDLAFTKYGSRSFDALWNAANFKHKLIIMDELSHKEGTWSNSEFGRIIAKKVRLSLYKRNKEEWKNSLSKEDKIKSLLNILD